MKKIFKLIGIIAFAAVFTLSATTCFGQSSKSALVGKWVAEDPVNPENSTTCEFFKDGSGTLTYKEGSDSLSQKFTWIATENGNLAITVNPPPGYSSDDSRFIMNCNYKISGSILTLDGEFEGTKFKRK